MGMVGWAVIGGLGKVAKKLSGTGNHVGSQSRQVVKLEHRRAKPNQTKMRRLMRLCEEDFGREHGPKVFHRLSWFWYYQYHQPLRATRQIFGNKNTFGLFLNLEMIAKSQVVAELGIATRTFIKMKPKAYRYICIVPSCTNNLIFLLNNACTQEKHHHL